MSSRFRLGLALGNCLHLGLVLGNYLRLSLALGLCLRLGLGLVLSMCLGPLAVLSLKESFELGCGKSSILATFVSAQILIHLPEEAGAYTASPRARQSIDMCD
jgi:hypothetical protein